MMRRYMPMLISLVCCAAAHAQFTSSVANNQVTILQYTGTDGAVTIPATINGVPVTGIASNAFGGCSTIMSVAIPSSVTAIGDQAFEGCSNLASAYFSGTAPSLGVSVFDSDAPGFAAYSYNNAAGFTYPTWNGYASVNFNYTAANGQIAVTGYTGSNSTVYIPAAINGMPVTSIVSNVFAGLINLTGVTIPNSVTNIGSDAFQGCTNLAIATISNALASIGDQAFSNCPSLTAIYFLGNAPGVGTAVFSGDGAATAYYLPRTTGWGSSLGGIPAALLPYTYSIASGQVTLVSYMGSGGAITIPSAIDGFPVAIVGDRTFVSTSVTSVIIPDSVTSIGSGAFAATADLASVTIPSSVTSIGSQAFSSCQALTSLTIPSSVTSIGNEAFTYSGFQSLTIPDSVTSLGSEEFYSCTKLTSVTFPNTLTSIGNQMFYGCTALSDITISGSISSIGTSAFQGCKGLATVSISGSVASIGSQAFEGCTSLANLTIPDGVTSIGEWAFYDCTSLTSVAIPDSVTSISVGAFMACSNLTSITVSTNNADFTSIDGVLFDNTQTDLVQYPGGKVGDYTIPDAVETVSGYAFYGAAYLTNVIIPAGVTTIGTYAFYDCNNLQGAVFLGNAPSNGESLFEGTSDFTVYYLANASGFSSPTWDDYPAVSPPKPIISSTLGATGTTSVAFSYQITANYSPTSFSAPDLPLGLVINPSTGLISGTPTEFGRSDDTINAINAGGTDSEILAFNIISATPAITSATSVSVAVGSAFQYQITASGGPVFYYTGDLPPGLSLVPSSGLISGTPTANGKFDFDIGASNGYNAGSTVLSLVVTVDPAKLRGDYGGLAVLNGTNTGLFTMAVTNKRSFTGKLALPDRHFSLKGTLSSYGAFTGTTKVSGTTLSVALAIDPSLAAVSGTIAAISASGTDNFAIDAGLNGKFNAATIPAGLAGRYTVVLPGANRGDSAAPQAAGYGTMSVSTAGAVHFTGKLGDGTAVSTGGQLHTDGKTWVLYDRLYAGHNPGSYAGQMTFESATDSDCDGEIDWIKPAQTTGHYYPAGFSDAVEFQAAKYTAPGLAPGAANLLIGGGDLPDAAVTASLIISSKEKVTVSGAAATLSVTAATGIFSGKFAYPVTNKNCPFHGVIFQKPVPAGIGLFFGPDQSGYVEISQ